MVAVACFLPGQGKDLSAQPNSCCLAVLIKSFSFFQWSWGEKKVVRINFFAYVSSILSDLNSFEITFFSVFVKWNVNYGQSETGLKTRVSDVVGHLSSLFIHGNSEKVFLCMAAACLVDS